MTINLKCCYLQVADVEHAILSRKGEVERLIADMKSANLESLTISPPEETKAFLDGKLADIEPHGILDFEQNAKITKLFSTANCSLDDKSYMN